MATVQLSRWINAFCGIWVSMQLGTLTQR